VNYGFYDDQWSPVVASGAHSQLIELNTMQYAASESDRYAGIYQTVKLVKGQKYQFQVKGLMRERDANRNEDVYRYRVQWGYSSDGSTDWTRVGNWAELPWDKIDERTSPTGLLSFSTTLTAPSDNITLFIRVWKKWGTAYRDLEVNLDAASLFGMAKSGPIMIGGPVVVVPGAAPATPISSTPTTCGGTNLIANGSFENGFVSGVGKSWQAFNNGGRAAYGFYDEQWPPVIKDGGHGQLIEINTLGLAASDADRYAGIYQIITGLVPGKTYEFSLWGMMRERTNNSDEDAYRYRVQWGYAAAVQGSTESSITSWAELPWNNIYLRTAPGDMQYYSVKIVAPSQTVMIGMRAWKKWGTPGRELDVNLDAIKLTGCSAPLIPPTPCPANTCGCTGTYAVGAGDTLGAIAAKYGTSVEALAAKNNIAPPYYIYTGQQLSVPCDGGVVVIPPQPNPPPQACIWVTVSPGDTLFGLALRYNSTVAQIMERNQLANPNLIYPGQKLCIVDP
jgi:LysM repeat protein